MHNIILIGFMGCGKSTLGKLLADNLDYTFIDSDNYIEAQEKKSIPEIFNLYGESYFRKKEQEFILHSQLLNKCVISTGAGLPCFENNMELLKTVGTTIWLNTDEDTIIERLKIESSSRPKLKEYHSIEDAVYHLLPERRKYYMQAKYSISNPTLQSLINIKDIN